MDYSNERWIRVYTRDTTTWKVMDWRARSVLMLLLRKVTRSGVLDVGGRGIRGLAAMIEMPLEIVTDGLGQLIEEGVVAETPTSYVLPKFIEAQEATTSDAQRSRDYRERQRDRELAGAVTKRDADETNRDDIVTGRHAPSPDATLESRVEEKRVEKEGECARPVAAPALALVPSPTPEPRKKRTPKQIACTDAERASVEVVLGKLSEQSGVTWTFCDTHAKLILARLRAGVSEWDLRIVIGYCASPKAAGGLGWRDDEKMAVYLRPATLFGPEKFNGYLPQARAWYERYVDDKRKGAS